MIKADDDQAATSSMHRDEAVSQRRFIRQTSTATGISSLQPLRSLRHPLNQ